MGLPCFGSVQVNQAGRSRGAASKPSRIGRSRQPSQDGPQGHCVQATPPLSSPVVEQSCSELPKTTGFNGGRGFFSLSWTARCNRIPCANVLILLRVCHGACCACVKVAMIHNRNSNRRPTADCPAVGSAVQSAEISENHTRAAAPGECTDWRAFYVSCDARSHLSFLLFVFYMY